MNISILLFEYFYTTAIYTTLFLLLLYYYYPYPSLTTSYRIKHEQELDSKSTAIHAKLLSPTQTTIHDFHKASPASSPLATQILTSPPGSFVILFPDEEAVRLEELEPEELRAIEAVIVIDGTWSQAAAINRCEPFTRLRKIRIDEGLRTVFWRYQDLGENCLSTIEAIYYFMCEAERVKSEGRDGLDSVVDGRKCLDGVVDKAFDGDGRDAPSNEKTDSTLTHSNLDNLLYFFSFFYHLIQDSYLSNPERKYTTKHRPDYIKREADDDE